MFTIISIVNNPAVASQVLLRGLSNQTAKHELILIQNQDSLFSSASKAYNSIISRVSSEYLLLIHQDVFLSSKDWLKNAEDELASYEKIGIAGVAGMTKPSYLNQFDICARYYLLMLHSPQTWFLRYGRGNVTHGKNAQSWGGNHIAKPVEVQTIDELLLIIPTSVLNHLKFDEKVCSDWHLYGADFALSSQNKGFKTYVFPYETYHLSEGNLSPKYFVTMSQLMNKHRSHKIINTTSGLFPTNKRLARILWPQAKCQFLC